MKADRGKIIAALKRCEKPNECEGCPYDGECARREFAVTRDVVSLLSAVAPIDTGNEYYVCGECRMPVINGWAFCPYCGKEVKWNGD